MVHDGPAELFRDPDAGWRVAALASQEQGVEAAEVMLRHMQPVRVLLPDGANGRGRGEQHADTVLGDDAPECAGVRGSDWLALV